MMSGDIPNNQSKHPSKIKKITRKRVFAGFVKSKLIEDECSNDRSVSGQTHRWQCCSKTFTVAAEIHKHVALCHRETVDEAMTSELKGVHHNCRRHNVSNFKRKDIGPCRLPGKLQPGSEGNCSEDGNREDSNCISSEGDEVNGGRPSALVQFQATSSKTKENPKLTGSDRAFPWLPSLEKCHHLDKSEEGQILLYYKYVDIENPSNVADWQRELCQRLQLTGKIRLATEGINGTVGGSLEATELYIQSVLAHPVFKDMTSLDFKKSSGGAGHFPKGLKVGVHKEIVPMGIDPETLSYRQAGAHLTPSEFHKEIDLHINSETAPCSRDTLFLDCRNFYESKIGQFKGAVTPNIRKFSYWPEYVDRNLDLFREKRVIMYCTGGIRCERGSAYLKTKGVCQQILQLRGGVHKYLEEYPDGHFKGKLFVFDDRYAIHTNNEVVASCFHCDQPWDQYRPCSSAHCHQLVLACPGCSEAGRTACCKLCRDIAARALTQGGKAREECLCTRKRERIPVEK